MAGGDAIYPLHLNKPRGHPIKGRLRGVEMTWGGSGKRPCGGGGKTAKGPLVLGGEVLLDIVQEGSGGFGEIFFVPNKLYVDLCFRNEGNFAEIFLFRNN